MEQKENELEIKLAVLDTLTRGVIAADGVEGIVVYLSSVIIGALAASVDESADRESRLVEMYEGLDDMQREMLRGIIKEWKGGVGDAEDSGKEA